MDKAAFEEIYRENADAVYQTALRYCENHYTAEEITQTVFMKLYVNLENINPKSINSWLLTTAKHMAINRKRHIKREILKENIEYAERKDIVIYDSLEDEYISSLYKEECRELVETIFSDLYSLNPRWYDAVTITYFLEKPQKEVADVMGVKLETLHSMLYRAKKWIRKNYKERFNHLDEE